MIGIGEGSKFILSKLRSVIYRAIKTLKTLNIKSSHFLIPSFNNYNSDIMIDLITRISVLSNHVFDKYLTLQPKHRIEKLTFISDNDNSLSIIKNAQIIAECTCLARELVNDRADTVTPQYLENQSISLVNTHPDVLKLKIIQHDELLSLGLNMITAVGQGAKHKARLIIIEYNGNRNQNHEKIALVGKGITFDTGGLNIKPTKAIEDMYMSVIKYEFKNTDV